MNKIAMLSFANIRKTKGHTVSLFIMFLIAAALLNAGLLVFLNFGNFFDKTTKELNTSNAYYIIPTSQYNSKIDDYLANDSNIINTQKEQSFWDMGSVKFGKSTREIKYILNDADQTRTISKWKFVGDHLPSDDMSIYLPYIFQLSGGYHLNDQFELVFDDIKLTFTIKGFTEDVMFSSLDTGIMGVYLPHDTFEKVSLELKESTKATLIYANFKKINKDADTAIQELTQSGSKTTVDITGNMFSIDLSLIKMSRVMMTSMMSVMIVAFSFMIIAVCLIVIRFRIGNSIEEDMAKIGSLKAIGYTSKQIKFSIVLQFTTIAFLGSIVGIALSYPSTSFLSDIFAQQSGLKWVQGFDLVISTCALCAILVIVVMVSFFTARRINRLNPIIALRGGIVTHNFRKNYLPLNTSKGKLSLLLSWKSLLQNMKQSLMIAIILVAISFAGTFAIVMFYNTTVDTKTFSETPGLELSNAFAILNPEKDTQSLISDIKGQSEVRKVQFIDEVNAIVDKNQLTVYVMEDFSTKETNTVYQGRYPLHSNEIVIAGHLASMMDKSIGDKITLKIGDNQEDYLISGLSQGANMGGMLAYMRLDAINKLDPNFTQTNLQIYLNQGVSSKKFIKDLKNLYGDSIVSVFDMDKMMQDGVGMYTSIVSKIGIVILVVTLAVVLLVLYFVINSSITRRKRELGIQKAIGFTTLQLMNQISLGFLPPIIIGVCIGSFIGFTQTNPIMTLTQSAMGIMKANYIIKPLWITCFGIAVVLVSYVTSMLITYRIRKISAYALVTE